MSNHVKGYVYEDSTFTLMSRFEVLGVVGVQADCSTITMKAWDTTDFTSTVLSASLTVANVVYDTLQTVMWEEDSTGYNFRYDVADTICVTPNRTYLFEAVITTTGGKLPKITWSLPCRETRSS